MDNICIDSNQSQNAMLLYQEKLRNKSYSIKECRYPCKFTRIFVKDKQPTAGEGELRFTFNKFIKTSKSRYSYGGLELLAELGGYMGLFLGVSVFQLKDGFNIMFQFMYK